MEEHKAFLERTPKGLASDIIKLHCPNSVVPIFLDNLLQLNLELMRPREYRLSKRYSNLQKLLVWIREQIKTELIARHQQDRLSSQELQAQTLQS